MYLAEQLKYSTKEQTKEKKKGSEAAFADAYRIHNSVKVFLFDILADGVKKDEKPEFFLRKSVDELNTELEGLEKNPEKLKAPIGNLSQKWCTEKEKSITGSLLGEAAIVESEANKKTALIVNLPQCPLPTTPVSAGEVFFLLPGSNPFVLSNKPINATWKQARKMLEEAQKAPLNAEKSEKMLNLLNDPGVRHIGIDGSVLRNLATHNPEICGSLLSKLPNNEVSEHVQSFIKGGVASDNIEKIMTKTSKLLEQINIRTYVGEIINQFKEKSLTAADKEILKRFCNFLHQLISQHSKENKELYIPDAVKKDLESIFKSCDNAEVLNKWNEMNKK
ncbi:CCR4-NOT transcription complex subunit 11, putative [Angomonas deanei]|uniref:CCR4-NOT transcription complex subunit 11 n=1 Tax=Angomonas deanei TaxID=59799 RepID=A0A7G2CGU4_9TRYP|nr:CCR4-NOT transcription complex subunit 11, putative [Angomonas deanei]